MLRRFLCLSNLRTDYDVALLVLRIGIGINLFLKHGWEKIVYFNVMAPHFFDPFGIGHYTTFMMAFTTDVIFSVFIMFGLFTRWCSVAYFALMFGAWWLRHHFLYWGLPPGVPGDHLMGDHGELIMVYFVAMITFMIAGAGRYSIDAWLARNDSK